MKTYKQKKKSVYIKTYKKNQLLLICYFNDTKDIFKTMRNEKIMQWFQN